MSACQSEKYHELDTVWHSLWTILRRTWSLQHFEFGRRHNRGASIGFRVIYRIKQIISEGRIKQIISEGRIRQIISEGRIRQIISEGIIKQIISKGLSVWADHPCNHQGIVECKLQRLKWADFDNNDGDGDDIRVISLIMKMMIYMMKIKTIRLDYK